MIFTSPPPQLPPKPTNIIVWIHGTNPKHFLPSFIHKLTEKTTSLFFHCEKGLIKSFDLDLQHYPFILTKTLSQCAPLQFSPEHFYTYGWEGELKLENRRNASYNLFNALKQLILEYVTKDGCVPHITLISHSHGGNIILHMAEINDPDNFNLYIQKVILLACPVQLETKHLIAHPMFGRIYSIHSHTDMIQIADPQGSHKPKKISRPFFSQRHFDSHPKLIQACIYWKNGPFWHPDDTLVNDHLLKNLTKAIKLLDKIKKKRGLFHIEFNLLPFVRHLPALIQELDDYIDSGKNCPTSSDYDVIIHL